MSTPNPMPDPADVQRLSVYGYDLDWSRHFILSVTNAAAARQFIGGLVAGGLIMDASVKSADVPVLDAKGESPVNIGFTFEGLRKLELSVPHLNVFREKAPAYCEGAHLRAARRLADTGTSAPAWWEKGFRQQDAPHVLLSLHASDKTLLDKRTDDVKAVPGRNGLDGWNAPMDGTHLTPAGQRTAHFGVRDGIANPLIQGFHSEKPKRKWHAPGELLLGYANDLDFNPWLLVDPWEQDSPWLLPRASIKPELFRNGSFAAFRKISQDEKAFRAFLAQCAIDMGETAEYWKAKMTGRWSDGQVVKPGEQAAPSAPPPDLDEFDFSDDPKAEGCPFGSHIRRMNPRKDRVVPFRRRPLMRRGMPYGPLFDKDPGKERGLLGLFFCASLEDQFEHLIAEWGNSNPMGPPNRGRAKDPIMGNHEDPGAQLEVPVPGSTLYEVDGFTPFVTTRGTLYAFYPGLAALAMIGKGQA